jgi:hypothetical protein
VGADWDVSVLVSEDEPARNLLPEWIICGRLRQRCLEALARNRL